MLGDFFTKPLQGHLFRKFRDAILGDTHVHTLTASPTPSTEERVGYRQSVERGLDHPGESDGFTLVKGKRSRTNHVHTNVSWADVVADTTGTRGQEAKKRKIVSGAFSRNNPVS